MSGIKGFSIVTIIFLCIAFFFLSVGNGKESEEDKSFREEYEKTMIGEMDFPLMVMSRVDFKDSSEKSLFEELDSSYLMADLHKKRFLLFFCYDELPSNILQIKRIVINDKYLVEFIQDDKIDNEGNSFVVFSVDPILTDSGKNIVITVFFKENNKLNFSRREFIIYPSYIKLAFEGIKEFYEKYYESRVEL